MKFTITINQEKAIEWGLNLQQSSLIDLFLLLPQWADAEVIDGEVWYFFAKPKMLEEMPILSKNGKVDTIYRQVKALQEIDLLNYRKVGRKDYWQLSSKIKEWSFKNSEKNPSNHGKKSELTTEKNPTDNNTIDDYITTDKFLPKTEFSEESFEYGTSKFFLWEMINRQVPQTIYNLNTYGASHVMEAQIDALDKLQRLDKYPRELIKMVIVFALNDVFWKNQILSLKKLREKNRDKVPYFIVLLWKMKEIHQTDQENIVHKF